MTRSTSTILAFALVLAASAATAESQSDIAARVNAEGEKLLAAKRFADASGKFREACARVPLPRYFYNLCESLDDEGKFSEALTACQASLQNDPPAELAAKARSLIAKIHDEAKRQNIRLHEH